MARAFDYAQKFESFKHHPLYGKLSWESQNSIRTIAFVHRLTFQEFQSVVQASRDLSMWGRETLEAWWEARRSQVTQNGTMRKKQLLGDLRAYLDALKKAPTRYPMSQRLVPTHREKKPITIEQSDRKIWGMCPVASEKTVCCNLRTIDAVQNCSFGCSYCTVQTFYTEDIVFDEHFVEKLQAIELDPDRFYHFGTGQASDALAWGNRNGNLGALFQFAADHPNVLLEFKTKSDNVGYLLKSDPPPNIVCSWSMNTPTIIDNEEHFTASFEARVQAAKRVVDRGIKVGFHFHPMVYHEGWERDYPDAASVLMETFSSDDVLFISLGSVTLIKPVIKKIRELGNPTKILQMELVPDPHGKLTYTDNVKIRMFKTMYQAFEPWHDRVFLYLCMEKPLIWEKAFGYVYEDNETFEKELGRQTMNKLPRRGLTPSLV